MGRGRKSIPDGMKDLAGTLRPDRTNADQPEPSAERPRPPFGLNPAECAHFETIVDRLVELRLASASHTEIIAVLARRLAEIDLLSAALDQNGHTYEAATKAGGKMIRMRPEVSARSEALRHMQGLLAELGLTPASNSKVSVPAGRGGAQKNPFLKAVS